MPAITIIPVIPRARMDPNVMTLSPIIINWFESLGQFHLVSYPACPMHQKSFLVLISSFYQETSYQSNRHIFKIFQLILLYGKKDKL